MEEELKSQIAGSVSLICSEYKKILSQLLSIPRVSAVLLEYQAYLSSTLQYASLHYMDTASIDLAVCKQRHDPIRMLSEVESRFNAEEQGFYHLYPDTTFRSQIITCFDAARTNFDSLDRCISAI